MRATKLILPVLLFINTLVVASDVAKLIPVKINNKWGYINESGKLLIPTSYDYAEEFDENGFAIVKSGPKYGLIDKFNNKVVPEKYDHIEVVDKTKILVKKGIYYGVVNLVNNTPIEFLYDQISTFENGFLKIKKDSLYGIVGKNGGLVSDPLFTAIKLANNFFICKQKGYFGVFNLKGEEILKPKYIDIIATNHALFFKDDQGLWGGVDARGEKIIPKVYDQLQLIATNLVKTTSGNKHGLVSLFDGKQIFDTKLTQVYAVNDNLVVVQDDYQYSLYNSSGSPITNDIYSDIRPLNSSLISFTKSGTKWGVVDFKGKVFLQEKYDHIGFYDYNMLKLVENGETGTKYIPEEYLVSNQVSKVKEEQIDAIDFFQEQNSNTTQKVDLSLAQRYGWFQYGKSKLWGLRTKEGKVLIRPVFSSIQIFEDLNYTKVELRYPTSETKKNHFISKKDGKVKFDVRTRFGVFNHSNNSFAVPPKFWSVYVEDFRQGDYAHAMLEGGYPCLIKNDGKDVKFSRIIKGKDGKKQKQLIGYIGKFIDGYALVNYGGKLSVSDDYSDNVVGDFTDALPDIQTNIENPYKYVTVDNGKWGYIDRTGKDIIKPYYDKARNMLNGVFPVMSGGLWGLVNEQSDTILDFTYSSLDVFDQSMGLFYTENDNSAYAMADKTGHVISEAVYEAIYDFHEGYARVRKDGKWTFIDDHGSMIVKPQFDELKDFSEGLAPAKVGKLWGFVDMEGNFIIKPQFADARDFYDGLAVVEHRNGYGYIDKSGEIVIEAVFSQASDFYDGVAVVKLGSSYGVIDNTGRWKIKPKYGKISAFDKNGYAVVGKTSKGGPYGLINTSGRQILSMKYSEIREVSEDMVAVKSDGLFGFANTNGKIIVKPKYKDVHAFHEGIAAIYYNGLWGYIDNTGAIVVDPTYITVHDFSEGKAVVEDKDHHQFVLEATGEEHELEHLKGLHDFHEGVAVAEADNNMFYFMDEDGDHIFQGDYEYAEDFIHGLAVVKTKNKYGLIDHNGNYVLPPLYDKIIHLKTGNAIIKMDKLTGLVSTNGLEVLETKYDKVTKFDNELLKVEQSGKIGYSNSVGNFIWDPQK